MSDQNNAEKIGGSVKRGGKRGGGQSKNIGEKRAKNQGSKYSTIKSRERTLVSFKI